MGPADRPSSEPRIVARWAPERRPTLRPAPKADPTGGRRSPSDKRRQATESVDGAIHAFRLPDGLPPAKRARVAGELSPFRTKRTARRPGKGVKRVGDVLYVLEHYYPYLIRGFFTTLLVSLIALAGSLIIGIVVAVLRIVPSKALNAFGRAYVEILRNIPLLLVAFFFYHGLTAFGLNLDGFTAGTLGLTVYTAAFIAEAVRAGIQAIPRGQMEAGLASGLSYVQTMRYIILPQAIKIVIPPIGNQFLNLVKNSSILSLFAGFDLMYWSDYAASDSFKTFGAYILAAAFYLLMTIPLSIAVRTLEGRLHRLPDRSRAAQAAYGEG
ncbi:MAG: amino acid ABC transporter permease [Hydrogenibacillus schlegelii]|nr:amino acid ABC transporter permease [Hydrogenibacillus schlegelii]